MTLTGKRDDVDAIVAGLTEWARRLYGRSDLTVARVTVPPAGFSSETFAFSLLPAHADRSSIERLVLRHLPEDPLFLDEDLSLQYSMMKLAGEAGIPVPRLVCFESDAAVLGRPFYIMRHIQGRIPSDRPSHHVEGWLTMLSVKDRAALTLAALQALAAIHRLDWRRFTVLRERAGDEPGLLAFLNWVQRWYRWVAGGRRYPLIEQALRYLFAARPTTATDDIAVLWGDPRLGNMAFTDDLLVEAVLDWENAALAPAEVDLGWWLMMDWFWSSGVGVTRLDGLLDRSQTIAAYEDFLGRPARDLAYYETLALTRFSIISVRQVDRRVRAGILPPGTVPSEENPIKRRLAQALADPAILAHAER